MPRHQPSVHRALGQVAIGVALSREDRRRRLEHTQMGMMAQQVQVPVSGFVGEWPTHAEDVRVPWPYPFIDGGSRSDSNLDVPHFSFGAELLSPLAVMILPHVVGWEQDIEGAFVAAKVRITSWIPFATKKHHFNAMLHCTFTGFAAPAIDESGVTDEG